MNKSRVILALGSNLGDRVDNIMSTISIFGDCVVKIGGLYETTPLLIEGCDQSWKSLNFINTAIELSTQMDPFHLLSYIKNIELMMGRENKGIWSPRKIDIDIIFYNSLIVNKDSLCLPHTECHKRDFVLRPISDIDDSIIHPVLNKTIREMLADCVVCGSILRKI